MGGRESDFAGLLVHSSHKQGGHSKEQGDEQGKRVGAGCGVTFARKVVDVIHAMMARGDAGIRCTLVDVGLADCARVSGRANAAVRPTH